MKCAFFLPIPTITGATALIVQIFDANWVEIYSVNLLSDQSAYATYDEYMIADNDFRAAIAVSVAPGQYTQLTIEGPSFSTPLLMDPNGTFTIPETAGNATPADHVETAELVASIVAFAGPRLLAERGPRA